MRGLTSHKISHTCIVGLVQDGKVYIGADSLGSNPEDFGCSIYDDKVFKNGDYLIGGCGSYREGQLLGVMALPEPPKKKKELNSFMYWEFMDCIRGTFLEKGALFKFHDSIEEFNEDSSFMIGVRGKLFILDFNLQVLECRRGYDAIGCGGQIAQGAMYATRHMEDPKKRIRIALEAAEAFSAGVRRPFKILSI